jgi:hypothetical protein
MYNESTMVPTQKQLQSEIAIRLGRARYAEFLMMRDSKHLHQWRLKKVLFEMVMNLNYADFDYE